MYTQLFLAGLATFALGAPAPAALEARQVTSLAQYAPGPATCPGTPLVRPATSLNSNEASYVSARKTKADKSLAAWLKKQGAFATTSLPSVGFTSSGGGYRALLVTAGVVQAIDSRDSKLGTSGVYQGLTYEAGLSGGAWFLVRQIPLPRPLRLHWNLRAALS